MKTSAIRRHQAGYISFLLVLSTGAILSALMFQTYRRALSSQALQSNVQLRLDYSEKEEAILRSIVAITPNRAIRAMQSDSDTSAKRNSLSWQNIFTESLVLANSRTSISPAMVSSMNVPNLKVENTGDAALGDPSRIFARIPFLVETGYISAGINRSLGTGYPPPLTVADGTTSTRDVLYPIISAGKIYGTLAQTDLNSPKLNGDGTVGYGLPVATYSGFNKLKYPNINFGYVKPGEPFVAKRNWWAFSVDVADHDDDKTFLARPKRNFVLSIYEIPSQLSISTSSFMSLGQHASGDDWQKVNIDGGVFVGKADVIGNRAIETLAIRRDMTMSNGSTVGGQSFPFTSNAREKYMNDKDALAPVSTTNQTTLGAFFPVSLASESGRAAFIPINRGAKFFDRFDPVENDPIEATGSLNHVGTNVLSTTTWNNYSIGAQQCAMRMDITQVTSSTNGMPTMLRFQYFRTNGNRASMNIPLTSAVMTTLPAGYVQICNENQSHTFTGPVDVAYGESGGYTFRQGLSGPVTFNNATFGDPNVGTQKKGYWRPRSPYDVKILTGGQICVSVYPERMPLFLSTIGAAPVGPGGAVAPQYNNSLAVNVDYTSTGLNDNRWKPAIPCRIHQTNPPKPYDNDFGVVLKECADLTPFTRGFSLVTNLRLYIGDSRISLHLPGASRWSRISVFISAMISTSSLPLRLRAILLS